MGQTFKRQNASRTLKYHDNQRRRLGSSLQRDTHVFESDLPSTVFNTLSPGASKHLFFFFFNYAEAQTVAPY